MANYSAIEWTQATWNPVTGCDQVSPGCAHCYAARLATTRLRHTPPYADGFFGNVLVHPDRLALPYSWPRSLLVFVNSMSDLFHPEVPPAFVRSVFEVMSDCPRHTFQVLTKRPERALSLSGMLTWPPNVWFGVSVENQRWAHRVETLKVLPAAVHFVSAEPLLGPVRLDLRGIDWVIVGGESGPRARPMDIAWARALRNDCQEAGTSFFLKQLGGRHYKRGGDEALLDGRTWREAPLCAATRRTA